MRILYGILSILVGVAVLKYFQGIYSFFGPSAEADRIFGSGLGGTRTAIKLLGLALILLGMMLIVGIL